LRDNKIVRYISLYMLYRFVMEVEEIEFTTKV
jgi:hypothetical protein